MTENIRADQAQELLDRAAGQTAATKLGASWSVVALLMTLGAASSMALVAMWLGGDAGVALPMVLFFVWISIAIVVHYRFGTATKRGFPRRYLITMGIWALVWVAGVVLTGEGRPADNLVGVSVIAGLLTAVTAGGAWWEASK